MQNLKIRVNSANESKEVQELFFKLGGSWAGYKKIHDWPEIKQLYLDENYITFSNDINFFVNDPSKEITLPELRAMVNPIKEWLNTKTFEYKQAACMFGYSEWIEIPEGAEIAILDDEKLSFAKPVNNGDDVLVLDVGHDVDWDTTKWESWAEFIDFGFDVIWQREQDEPFLTPECTLNDQYVEIEQVRQAVNKSWGSVGAASGGAAQTSGGVDATLAERQSTYGNFEDVAFVTENIMSILAKVRVNGVDDLPNTHRMALYMIASKMARIVNGDFNHLDSWHDIGGYAKLIEKLIKGE